MILCRVQGQAVASVKDPHLNNNKLLVCRPVELDGESPAGREFLALDRVKAGPGDLVLCVYEGSSARGVFENRKIPVAAFTVAIVDDLELLDEDSLAGTSVVEQTVASARAEADRGGDS